MYPEKIRIEKLEAARKQLDTAIELWFFSKDPISIHTLAAAAYEIIHVFSKKIKKRDRDLLFDSIIIKDEYRNEFNIQIKHPSNFFKHANKDPEGVIEFFPFLSELFILFSLLGLELSGEKQSDIESAFMWWIYLHKPHLLTEHGRSFVAQALSTEQSVQIAKLSKAHFLNIFLKERNNFRDKHNT